MSRLESRCARLFMVAFGCTISLGCNGTLPLGASVYADGQRELRKWLKFGPEAIISLENVRHRFFVRYPVGTERSVVEAAATAAGVEFKPGDASDQEVFFDPRTAARANCHQPSGNFEVTVTFDAND